MTVNSSSYVPPQPGPPYHHYALYLTKPSGRLPAGYILVTTDTNEPDNLPIWYEGTAWIIDPEHKYVVDETYPELVAGESSDDKKSE